MLPSPVTARICKLTAEAADGLITGVSRLDGLIRAQLEQAAEPARGDILPTGASR